MSAPYSGRCACGSVSATISGEPVGVALCWCRQCQQIAAGGATGNAIFQAGSVAMTGQLAALCTAPASGNSATQHFCPDCGTPVYGLSSGAPGFVAIRLGFLDAGHGLEPEMAIWIEEAPDWAMIDPTLERFGRQPTPPPQA